MSVDRPPEEYYFPQGGGEPSEPGDHRSSFWRGLVISIIVAIILSVTATLLLGGIFRPNGVSAAMRCAKGADCSPPPDKDK